MSIIYALIARGDVVLTEYSAARGNFIQVTRDLIKRVDPFTARKMSYSYDDRIHYHIMVRPSTVSLPRRWSICSSIAPT